MCMCVNSFGVPGGMQNGYPCPSDHCPISSCFLPRHGKLGVNFMSPSKVRCSILGFNPVLFNDSILMKISLEFPGALPKGPVMCPVLSPCTRSDRSTLRAPLSWALQRTESRRTEWLSLAQGHWTTGHARFKESVPSWLRRGMGKNRKEVEIFIFPQHRGRKKSSPFPANKGERKVPIPECCFENYFWVFPAEGNLV